MNMVFIYEDKIAQDNEGNYYTGSAFSQAVFDRYLRHFDHITLIMRKAPVAPGDSETLSHMNRIDSDRIDVAIIPNTRESLKSFLTPSVHRELKDIVISEIDKAEAVIIRAHSGSGYVAARYCNVHHIPYLAEAVGCPWDSLWNHSLRGKVLAPVIFKQMRFIMKHASYAVYVTDTFLQHRYPTDGKSAAISDVELQPADEQVLISRLEHIRNHSGKIRIGTAGALHVSYKGQRYVIRALAKLKARGYTNYEYHLAGGGDNTALINQARKYQVENQVIFDGVLPHDDMFKWLDNLDVYIQPSQVEAMPRALIEAMSRGLPCFGSEIGGIPELLGRSGIFDRGDVNAIAKKICSLTSGKMEHMAKRNFNYAKRFEKKPLEEKRFDFYASFAAEVEGRRYSWGKRKYGKQNMWKNRKANLNENTYSDKL